MSRLHNHFVRGSAGIAGALLVGGLGVLLAGCPSQTNETSSTTEAPVAQSASFAGVVFGGRQPIECSTVTAYAAATIAGATPIQIGSGATGGDGTNCPTGAGAGQFSFNFSPAPASGAIVYVVAVNGYSVPNLDSKNSAIKLMTVAGPYCSTPGCGFPNNVNVNELSTVASAYSMAGFIALPGGGAVNIAGTSPGLPNAAKNFASLVNAADGKATVPGATDCTGSGEPVNCEALRRLDTLANIVAVCVNTHGRASTPCVNLFNNTWPTGGTVPIDTLRALVNLVTVPEIRNKGTEIYGLSPGSTIYSPVLTAAPNAWMLALNHAGGGLASPDGIAIDAEGNVWTASKSSINKFDPTGVPISPASGYTGGGLNRPYGIAVDTAGNVWAANFTQANGTYDISKFSSSGTALSPPTGYSDDGLSAPWGIAVDATGYVWITSRGGTSSLNKFDPTSNEFVGSGYTGGGLGGPRGVAVDGATGHVWTTSASNDSINEFDPSSGQFVGSGYSGGGGLEDAYSIAFDNSGHVWTVSYGNSSINEFDPATSTWLSPISTGYTGGGLVHAYAIAVDAAGHIWTASRGNSSVNEFDPGTFTWLSPASGYTAANLDPYLFSIAVDPSGNVWVSNIGTSTVTEFIGAAAPTHTPIVSTLTHGLTP